MRQRRVISARAKEKNDTAGFSLLLPTYGLALVFGWVALSLAGLSPVAVGAEVLTACDCQRLAWADHARELELEPELRLTDSGELIVSGTLLGWVDVPDAEALRGALQDLAARMVALRQDVGEVPADTRRSNGMPHTIILTISPSAPMGRVKALLRAARVLGIDRYDLAVDTWARY